MEKVTVKVVVKSTKGSQSADFKSGVATAKTPATPLQTLISTAAYLARVAEIYEGEGDALAQAVIDSVKAVKLRIAQEATKAA